MIKAIVGANYGDEGKGLATNFFTRNGKNLVVRHNGGAQSGHTVETDEKRFVFHELSAGSFNGADTYWADTYHPDLYILKKEFDDFRALTGIVPTIYCHPHTKITLIDDICLNRFKETQQKWGSTGMGIWECVCRNNAGYGVTVEQVQRWDLETLYTVLKQIRDKYSVPRLLRLTDKYRSAKGEYHDMLLSDTVLFNYALAIKNNAEMIKVVDLGELFEKYNDIVFEGGQGLLIDGDLDEVHGTPSKTGLHNVIACLGKYGRHLDEAVYITRTYLTRHGAGDFVKDTFEGIKDETNIHNEWQESMRFGRFDSIEDLVNRIKKDCKGIEPSIMVTHTNTTDGGLMTTKGEVSIKTLPFKTVYISDNKKTAKKV